MYMCVCSMHTFIQVLTRTDRITIVLQCSLRAPTLTPKYIPSGISLLASSRFSAQNRRIRSVPTDSVLGLTDRSQPIRFSASSADPADVELVSQQPHSVNRAWIHLRFTSLDNRVKESWYMGEYARIDRELVTEGRATTNFMTYNS